MDEVPSNPDATLLHAEDYRCPTCGTYFERQTFEQTFLAGSSTYDSYRLSRWAGSAEELEVRDRAREGDVHGLSLLLRSERDDAARLRVLATPGRS